MGLRQMFGFIFMEFWFSVKEEFRRQDGRQGLDLSDFFKKIANSIQKTAQKIRSKYKEIIAKFGEGMIGGMLGSLTTTVANIFFTTAKNVVRIIRQAWASLVEAVKILLLNPDNLLFGDFKEAYKFNFAQAPDVRSDQSVAFRTGSTVYRAMCLADGKPADKNALVCFTKGA